MSLLTLVDSHLVRHRARSEDVMGQTLCGYPPVGVLLTDPAPNLDPRAKYVEKCGPCEAVAQGMGVDVDDDDSIPAVLSRGDVPPWAAPMPTPRRAGKGTRWFGKGGATPAKRGDHVHPPDPLTAPWKDLLEE